MVAWSFAKLKYVHKGLLDAIRGDLAVRAGAFPAPELTGVMYAFARLKQSMPASTLRVCADVLTVSIADLPPHEVSVTVWSMAKMGHLHAPLMQAAAETVYARRVPAREPAVSGGVRVRVRIQQCTCRQHGWIVEVRNGQTV